MAVLVVAVLLVVVGRGGLVRGGTISAAVVVVAVDVGAILLDLLVLGPSVVLRVDVRLNQCGCRKNNFAVVAAIRHAIVAGNIDLVN